jgi:hypothetical protein
MVNSLPRQNHGFTCIERAFVATTVDPDQHPPIDVLNISSSGEMEQDESRTRKASKTLHDKMKLIDSKMYQEEYAMLKKQLEDDRLLHQEMVSALTTKLDALYRDDTTKSITNAQVGGLTYAMSAMLDRFDSLDDSSKNALMQQAISSNNEALQSRLLML